MKYKVEPTNETGQSLLVSIETRPNSNILPMVSVQLPTEVANELANAANKRNALIQTLKEIESICEAPHWTAERRWNIGRKAHHAWVNS